MSSKVAISVKDLGKSYEIYEQPHDRLKQFLLPRLNGIFGSQKKRYYKEFWALKDVSFEVEKGDTIGIIGRNGSGKSTLLQLICGTLSPTVGTVATNGRVAALLELGSGFNPEFTGRENVYMNASVLGLRRDEVDDRFDEIAAFADIGDFIEKPVKMYSSGMMLRLAFAVQICVDPDILIIDEAMAVGDIGFQYKCFKRLESLRDRGVTIIMVTHSSGSILNYADRCILLEGGTLKENSKDVLSTVLRYEKNIIQSADKRALVYSENEIEQDHSIDNLKKIQSSEYRTEVNEKRFGSARALIKFINIYKTNRPDQKLLFMPGDEISFVFHILSSDSIEDIALGVSISNTIGVDIWGDNNIYAGRAISLKPGSQAIEYRARLPLTAGEYLVHAGLACLSNSQREELDQRRPFCKLTFTSAREAVGTTFSPIQVISVMPACPVDLPP